MEMFIFDHASWQSLYNCSKFPVDAIPIEKRRQFLPEACALIILSTIYFCLYIPCMISIWKHLAENACYKLLFFIGVWDIINIWGLGFVHAWQSIEGMVFCSSPIFNFWIGIIVAASWGAESTADLVLAINRCLDILAPSIAEKLFSGFRIYIWLGLCTSYAFYWITFLKPVVFSSLIFAWPFDPFVGYREDVDREFAIPYHIVQNVGEAILFPSIYATFVIGMYIKSRSFGTITITKAQKMAFLQVFIITALNGLAVSVYVTIDINYNISPQWLITLGQFAWYHVHGFPPVIYLALNQTIRTDCKMLFLKLFRPNQVQKIHGVTIIVQPKNVGITMMVQPKNANFS